jgi:myo-inositol-1(or 4)-monophosphatase
LNLLAAKVDISRADYRGHQQLLAMGHLDAIIEATLQPWDVAALVPVVENAGGVLTDWSGAVTDSGRIVASGDARVHAEVLKVLAQYKN